MGAWGDWNCIGVRLMGRHYGDESTPMVSRFIDPFILASWFGSVRFGSGSITLGNSTDLDSLLSSHLYLFLPFFTYQLTIVSHPTLNGEARNIIA